jgi:hypothetical protein
MTKETGFFFVSYTNKDGGNIYQLMKLQCNLNSSIIENEGIQT